MPAEITQAGPARLSALASLLGRAFIDEPMMRWPLGEHGDVAKRFSRFFERSIERLVELGMVWEAGEAMGAMVWIPPEGAKAWHETQIDQPEIHALTDDGGRRYDAFWEWVESRIPDEPLAHLDAVGVEPSAQGRGLGSSLIEFGLARARAAGHGVFLETGAHRNVSLYERHGFRLIEDARAPGGGPTVWFMRWDP